jgi:hypothetical protein
MNQHAYDEHNRLKGDLVDALELRQNRTWAWAHLLAKVRELKAKAGCAFRRELADILGAGGTGSGALLEAARALRAIKGYTLSRPVAGAAVTINGERYVREDGCRGTVEPCKDLRPCPRCRRAPKSVLTRPSPVDVGGANVMADVYLCPACKAPVGVAFCGNTAFWTWNRLVELAPERAPALFKRAPEAAFRSPFPETPMGDVVHSPELLRAVKDALERGGLELLKTKNCGANTGLTPAFALLRQLARAGYELVKWAPAQKRECNSAASPLGVSSLLEDMVMCTRAERSQMVAGGSYWVGDDAARRIIESAVKQLVHYIRSGDGRMTWERAYDKQMPDGRFFPRDAGYQALWLMLDRLFPAKGAAQTNAFAAYDPLCSCGHAQSQHYAGRGSCAHQTHAHNCAGFTLLPQDLKTPLYDECIRRINADRRRLDALEMNLEELEEPKKEEPKKEEPAVPWFVRLDDEFRLRSSSTLKKDYAEWTLITPPVRLTKQLRAAWSMAEAGGFDEILKVMPRHGVSTAWEWDVEVV